MANKSGGCRFAVGASNYTMGACGAARRRFPPRLQFRYVPLRRGGRWMRGRVQMGDTGANNEGIQIRPWPVLPRHDGAVW